MQNTVDIAVGGAYYVYSRARDNVAIYCSKVMVFPPEAFPATLYIQRAACRSGTVGCPPSPPTSDEVECCYSLLLYIIQPRQTGPSGPCSCIDHTEPPPQGTSSALARLLS